MTIYIFLYILFIAISSSMLIWGLLKKDRVFQYPTIAGVSWLVFFGVQALGAIRNPEKYPKAVLNDGGLTIAMAMLCLCSAAGWLGYYHADRGKRSLRFKELSDEKIFWGGVVLYGIGFFSAFKLAQLTGGFIQQFTGGGHYGLEWRGAPVRYAFFSQLVYPGIALALMSTMRRFSYSKLYVCIVMMLYPAAVIAFLGRRSKVAILGGIILLTLFFARKIRIPRVVCVIILIAAFIVIYYGGAYRSASQYGLNYNEIADSIAKADVKGVLKGEKFSEFDVMVVWGAAVNRDLAFRFGIDIYNNMVSFYVPRQIVGEQFKRSLIIHSFSRPAQEAAKQFYDWVPNYGTFLTGPFTAFNQFWFFGCLFYYVFGYVFRLLWEAAYTKNSLSAQIWYISCFVLIPLSIMSSIVSIPARLIYIAVFMWFVTRLCRIRSQNRFALTPEDRLQSTGFNAEYNARLPMIWYPFVRNKQES